MTPQTVSIIHAEHQRIRHVLAIVGELRRQLADSREPPDARLFGAIFDYIDFYERMHYPKEERYLFKALRARAPDAHALLDELEVEHAGEPPALARLRRLLQAAVADDDARRDFLNALDGLCDGQEQHIEREESQVIALALAHLTPQDWQVVDAGCLHHDHLLQPLVGETLGAEFDELHSRVIYYAPEPYGLGLAHSDREPVGTAETLGLPHGLHTPFGHVRALLDLSEADWQDINRRYLNYDDPEFGRIVTAELRQLRSWLTYYAPAPLGLGLERTHRKPITPAVDQVLRVSGLSVHYGRIQALADIGIRIDKGELVALVGSNGAGKTTLLRTLSGLQPAGSGQILFGDRDITRLRADQRVKLGITQIPEGRQVFGPLSVEDNLRLGAYTRAHDPRVETDLEQMYEMFPILRQKRKQVAGTLSGGQQQMLVMARALMARPLLLLLDEPSMGLAPILVEEVFNTIGELQQRGITIFLVEQNAAAALAIADRGYVIETGRIVLSGSGRELLADDQVKAAYLGK
jgi:ABC-type branched-subunit amino acid transport system ATPase component/hemerythrin-like domain-containing protein